MKGRLCVLVWLLISQVVINDAVSINALTSTRQRIDDAKPALEELTHIMLQLGDGQDDGGIALLIVFLFGLFLFVAAFGDLSDQWKELKKQRLSSMKKKPPQIPKGSISVAFSDIEGRADVLDAVLRDSQSLDKAGLYKIFHLGDVFEPSSGNIRDIFNTLIANKVESIFGNRDLNKLRFLTELHPTFLAFLSELNVSQRKYVMIRLMYWTIHPQRRQQIIDADGFASLTKGSAGTTFPRDEFANLLARKSMGVRSDYAIVNFGGSTSASITDAVYQFVSKDTGFRQTLQQMQFMRQVGGMLMTHSGLGDAVLVDVNKLDPSKGDLYLKWGADPYKPLGGLRQTMDTINKRLNAEVLEAFAQSDARVASMVQLLKGELESLKALGNDNEQLGAAVDAVVKRLQDYPANAWPVLFEFPSGLANTLLVNGADRPLQLQILNNIYKPLGRPGELAIDASLPYPLRTSIGGDGYMAITTNSAIGYYMTLLKNLMSTSPKIELLSHVCDLAVNKVKVMLIGHFGPAGPLVLRFEGKMVADKCKMDVKSTGDIVVAFIDPTAYPENTKSRPDSYEKADNTEFVEASWVYVFQKAASAKDGTDAHYLRFKSGDGVVTVDLQDTFNGAVAPIANAIKGSKYPPGTMVFGLRGTQTTTTGSSERVFFSVVIDNGLPFLGSRFLEDTSKRKTI